MRSVERRFAMQGTTASLTSSSKSLKKIMLAGALALAGMLGAAESLSLTSTAQAAPPPPAQKANDQFFDWFENMTPGYLPSPFLTDQNRDAVNAILEQHPGIPLR